jgi:hypothetical protein
MTGKRNIGSIAAIGGLSAAIALMTGLPAVSADELADLRANQSSCKRDRSARRHRLRHRAMCRVRARDAAGGGRSRLAASRDRF